MTHIILSLTLLHLTHDVPAHRPQTPRVYSIAGRLFLCDFELHSSCDFALSRIAITFLQQIPVVCETMNNELGQNPDRQTVQPLRDCLITEIPPLHQGNQTVRSN